MLRRFTIPNGAAFQIDYLGREIRQLEVAIAAVEATARRCAARATRDGEPQDEEARAERLALLVALRAELGEKQDELTNIYLLHPPEEVRS
jgi:hypothetical protein